MSSVLSAPHFHNEEAAYAFIETRVWPEGPICPHCGGYERISKMQGKSTRIGAYKCYQCRKPFTVKIGTVFEGSHVALHLWLQAMYLMCASKNGISSNQLHRTLGVTLKTAWFMCHRIREAMRSGDLAPLGKGGGYVEVDENYIGRDKTKAVKVGYEHKFKVLSLLDRDTGRTRMMHVEKVTMAALTPILVANIAAEANLLTDDAGQYRNMHRHFASHATTAHTKGSFVDRHDARIHTNTVEWSFSIFKRGIKGVYQHCSGKHFHRYLDEFEFRYSNRLALVIDDTDRTVTALLGVVGKRLTYRPADRI